MLSMLLRVAVWGTPWDKEEEGLKNLGPNSIFRSDVNLSMSMWLRTNVRSDASNGFTAYLVCARTMYKAGNTRVPEYEYLGHG